MITEQVINGWLCEVDTDDETGLVDVHLVPTEENNHEMGWIVRGEVPETAIQTATKVIAHLQRGDHILHHDPEGIIKIISKEQVDRAIGEALGEDDQGEDWKKE
jgi:hypothetical protein